MGLRGCKRRVSVFRNRLGSHLDSRCGDFAVRCRGHHAFAPGDHQQHKADRHPNLEPAEARDAGPVRDKAPPASKIAHPSAAARVTGRPSSPRAHHHIPPPEDRSNALRPASPLYEMGQVLNFAQPVSGRQFCFPIPWGWGFTASDLVEQTAALRC